MKIKILHQPPRFYAKDRVFNSEQFRKVDKSSETIADFSLFTEKGETLKSRLFYNFNKFK